MAGQKKVRLLPTSDADWTIHSLNIQGTFSSDGVRKLLKNRNGMFYQRITL